MEPPFHSPSPQPLRGLLLGIGILFVAAAVLWPVVSRYVGRLPGDVVVRRGNFTSTSLAGTRSVIQVISGEAYRL
jgi:hypothetical protein